MMKSVLPILSGVFSFGILFLNAGETVSKNSEKNNSNTTGTVVATEIPESSSEAVEQTINITTLDGKVYKDATIERITPSGIDIGYVRDDGSYAMIGLPLANLSSDLQKAFNYDPQKAKAFDAKIEKLKNKSLEDTAENEATRMARIAEEIKAKLAGGDVKIKPADLRFAIYARRRPVVIIPVEQVQSGTVVALVDDNSNLPTLPTLILIDKLKLSEKSGKWSGFLYPTGMKARYRDIDKIPVFSDSLDEAQVLLERYLDIYSEFAAEQKANNTATPPQTPTTPPDQAETGTDETTKSDSTTTNDTGVVNNYYYDNYPYYIGQDYRPVIWYSRRYWNDWGPRPPYPPPPPKPGPQPPKPGPQPPKPGPQPPKPRPQPPKPGPQPRTYQVEHNGGFRRVVPKSPTPANQSQSPKPNPTRSDNGIRPAGGAHPASWGGTPAPSTNPTRSDNGIRPAGGAHPASWGGTPAPSRPAGGGNRPSGGGGNRGRGF